MLHSTLHNMLDEMLANPDEIFVSSNSKHCALYSTDKDAILFLEGDFSGSPQDCEAEVRRLMDDIQLHKVVIAP
jgi:hypothetical protein